jgi:hypothetical protein
MIKYYSNYYYIKDVDNNKVVSGILNKVDSKKKLQQLELNGWMDDIIETKGSLGLN